MDDDRQARSPRQIEMAGEVVFLLRKRRIVPVAIEPCFPDADDERVIRQADDIVPGAGRLLGDVIGMQAHRRAQHRVRFRERQIGLARFRGRRHRDDALDPYLRSAA